MATKWRLGDFVRCNVFEFRFSVSGFPGIAYIEEAWDGWVALRSIVDAELYRANHKIGRKYNVFHQQGDRILCGIIIDDEPVPPETALQELQKKAVDLERKRDKIEELIIRAELACKPRNSC